MKPIQLISFDQNKRKII